MSTSNAVRMAELLPYLLDNRHRLPNQVIIDCLALAQLDQGPRQRVGRRVLQAHLQVGSQSHLSLRLKALRSAGLLDYERGVRGDPGYLIRRLGPTGGCVLQSTRLHRPTEVWG